jgi:hypothetical protein
VQLDDTTSVPLTSIAADPSVRSPENVAEKLPVIVDPSTV